MEKKITASIILLLVYFVLLSVNSPVAAISPQGNCALNEIDTALGCISSDASGGFLIDIIRIIIGLGGGIALILILIGTVIITTSAGIPEKITIGQQIITSSISGLLFIILSVFLMNLIGVKILDLPGL